MMADYPRPVPRPGIEERGPLENYRVWRSQQSLDNDEVPHEISLGDMRALALAQARAEQRGVNPRDVADLAFPTALVEGRPAVDKKGRPYAQPAYGANSIPIKEFHTSKYANPAYDFSWRFPAEIKPDVYYGSDPNIGPAARMGLSISPTTNLGLGEKGLSGEILPLRPGDRTVVDKSGQRFRDNYMPEGGLAAYYDERFPYSAPHSVQEASPYDARLHQAQLLQAHLAAAAKRAKGRPIAEAWNGKGKTAEADSVNHGNKVAEMQRMLQHPYNRGALEDYQYMVNHFRRTVGNEE